MEDDEAWQRFRKWHDPESHFDARERELFKLDEAWAKASLGLRTGVRFGHGNMRARSLVKVHDFSQVYKRRNDRGDTLSLLQAVAFFAEENLPLPEWLATAFCDALNTFTQPGTCTSLDQVFHSKTLPTDTPQKTASAKQDWLLGGTIWSKVWDVAIEDEKITSLDAALTAALKKEKLGVGKTKARELFLMIDKNQSEMIQCKTLSRFLELRRKQKTSV